MSGKLKSINKSVRWRHSIEIVCAINILWALPMVMFREPKRVQFLKSQMSVHVMKSRIQNARESDDLRLTQHSVQENIGEPVDP